MLSVDLSADKLIVIVFAEKDFPINLLLEFKVRHHSFGLTYMQNGPNEIVGTKFSESVL